MSSLKIIDTQLKALHLIRKEIPKDGSCLFRCVSEAIFGTQNYHSQVRKQCIKYLELNRDSFEPFACIHNPWEKYILEMKKDGTWGGEIELQAISLIYEVNFIIYIGNNNTTNVNNGFKKNIELAYCHGEHYDLVVGDNHLKLYRSFQSLVYEIMFDAMGKKFPIHGVDYTNIPMKIWEAEDKIKQIRDSKIVEKLLQTQSVNKLDEYELNKNKKKPLHNNNKNNNKNRNTIKGSNDSSDGINNSINSKGKGNNKKNLTESNENKKGKNFLLLSTDSDESIDSINSNGKALSTSSTPTNELIEEQEVDEELKEIFRQIELQELEEQRLIGLEKHFPTLPPSNNPKPNKLDMFENSNTTTSTTTTTTTTTTSDDQSNEINTTTTTTSIASPPPVWGKPQNWTEIIQNTDKPTEITANTTIDDFVQPQKTQQVQTQQPQVQLVQVQQPQNSKQSNEKLYNKPSNNNNRNYNNNNNRNYNNNNNRNNRNNYNNNNNVNNVNPENANIANDNNQNNAINNNNYNGGNKYRNNNNYQNQNNNRRFNNDYQNQNQYNNQQPIQQQYYYQPARQPAQQQQYYYQQQQPIQQQPIQPIQQQPIQQQPIQQQQQKQQK